ncbi:MAG: hypothetical protein MPN21_09380 [Thermoanaerobaculia bacterium]|nr:hypothetical protein [Thermoanaerobaculia bacterium]
MSKHEIAPTMIIPSGTEIQIDVHGQLSVRTPGNLVIQNSGHYGEIESVNGSIRIEAGAEVEAVAVRCAETCYVQGSLTSWKVKAKSIQLEEQAQARVVLQETEQVEIGKNAKLVGNFDSEKELFLLFSRFARQLRNMPFYFDRAGTDAAQLEEPSQSSGLPPGSVPRPGAGNPPPPAAVKQADLGAKAVKAPGPSSPPPTRLAQEPAGSLASEMLDANQELPDQLFFSLVLLERESKNESYGSGTRKVVEEIVKLLRGREFEALRHTHQALAERLVEPGDDLQRAVELIRNHFKAEAAAQTQNA